MAAELRCELKTLKTLKDISEGAWSDARERYHGNHWYTSKDLYDTACVAYNAACSRVSSKEAEITLMVAAPPPVLQPIPRQKTLALGWLFIFHMPSSFRMLSRFSFLSQQMLLPSPSDEAYGHIFSAYCTPIASNVYNQLSSVTTFADDTARHVKRSDGCVMLQSRRKLPRNYGPNHVDNFTSPEDGVWYPDDMRPDMVWYGSSCSVEVQLGFVDVGCFNPFAALPAEVPEQLFTEKLKVAPHLQWTMHVGRSVSLCSDKMGNRGIADQREKPGWLISKPSFLTFTSLRSYPTGQLRRLCDALHQKELPLSHPGVIALVRQVLYHIGTLHVTPAQQIPGLLWRTDWEVEGDVLSPLCCELEQLASELDPAPRDHDAVLLLGEVAAYLSTWYPACAAVTRRFAAMTSRVADEMEENITGAAPQPAVQQQLQARQCHLRMLSLLCYGAGALTTDEDIADTLRLTVLIKHFNVMLDTITAEQALSMRALLYRCMNIMARRSADTILSLTPPSGPLEQLLLHVSKGYMLTAAISSVLQRTPANLQWYRIDANGSRPIISDTMAVSSSYEAEGDDGHLYSINVLNGTVLLDGNPPGRLPR
jgi:hypothetical protein